MAQEIQLLNKEAIETCLRNLHGLRRQLHEETSGGRCEAVSQVRENSTGAAAGDELEKQLLKYEIDDMKSKLKYGSDVLKTSKKYAAALRKQEKIIKCQERVKREKVKVACEVEQEKCVIEKLQQMYPDIARIVFAKRPSEADGPNEGQNTIMLNKYQEDYSRDISCPRTKTEENNLKLYPPVKEKSLYSDENNVKLKTMFHGPTVKTCASASQSKQKQFPEEHLCETNSISKLMPPQGGYNIPINIDLQINCKVVQEHENQDKLNIKIQSDAIPSGIVFPSAQSSSSSEHSTPLGASKLTNINVAYLKEPGQNNVDCLGNKENNELPLDSCIFEDKLTAYTKENIDYLFQNVVSKGQKPDASVDSSSTRGHFNQIFPSSEMPVSFKDKLNNLSKESIDDLYQFIVSKRLKIPPTGFTSRQLNKNSATENLENSEFGVNKPANLKIRKFPAGSEQGVHPFLLTEEDQFFSEAGDKTRNYTREVSEQFYSEFEEK